MDSSGGKTGGPQDALGRWEEETGDRRRSRRIRSLPSRQSVSQSVIPRLRSCTRSSFILHSRCVSRGETREGGRRRGPKTHRHNPRAQEEIAHGSFQIDRQTGGQSETPRTAAARKDTRVSRGWAKQQAARNTLTHSLTLTDTHTHTPYHTHSTTHTHTRTPEAGNNTTSLSVRHCIPTAIHNHPPHQPPLPPGLPARGHPKPNLPANPISCGKNSQRPGD